MTNPAMAVPTRRVDMWYAGTAPQRRMTVAFRIILAIPQFIVLYFLFLATFFVVVIGWFGALFMGRLPEWVHSFVSGVVRWTTRVYAYMYLLTDRYPPFSLDDEDYPARPIIPAGGRLNRWAVLFRLILVIPAAVFAQIVEYGLSFPLLFVVWVITLFSGRMHPSLYPAYAALLRYQVRLHSYFLMLTSEYAWGMLGDPIATAPPAPFFPASQGPCPSRGRRPTRARIRLGRPRPHSRSRIRREPRRPRGATRPRRRHNRTHRRQRPTRRASPRLQRRRHSGRRRCRPRRRRPASGPCHRRRPGSGAVPALPTGDETPAWATLTLAGAARGWVIFAIVWGSVLFLGQNVAQNVINNHNRTTGVAQVNAVVSDYNSTDAAFQTAFARNAATTTVLRDGCLSPRRRTSGMPVETHPLRRRPARHEPAVQRRRPAARWSRATRARLASIITQLANSSDISTYRSTVQAEQPRHHPELISRRHP